MLGPVTTTPPLARDRGVGHRNANGVLSRHPASANARLDLPETYSNFDHFVLLRLSYQVNTGNTVRSYANAYLFEVDDPSTGDGDIYCDPTLHLINLMAECHPPTTAPLPTAWPPRSQFIGWFCRARHHLQFELLAIGSPSQFADCPVANCVIEVVEVVDLPRSGCGVLPLGYRNGSRPGPVPSGPTETYDIHAPLGDSSWPTAHVVHLTHEVDKDRDSYDARQASPTEGVVQIYDDDGAGGYTPLTTIHQGDCPTTTPFTGIGGPMSSDFSWQEQGNCFWLPAGHRLAALIPSTTASGAVNWALSNTYREIVLSEVPYPYYYGQLSAAWQLPGVAVPIGAAAVGATVTGAMVELPDSAAALTETRFVAGEFYGQVDPGQSLPTDLQIDVWVIDDGRALQRSVGPGVPAGYAGRASWLGVLSFSLNPSDSGFATTTVRRTRGIERIAQPGERLGYSVRVAGGGYAAPSLDGVHVYGRIFQSVRLT